MAQIRTILINKCAQEAISADLTTLAEIIGVCDETLRSRLPYWEDKDWIVVRVDEVKSKRGGDVRKRGEAE